MIAAIDAGTIDPRGPKGPKGSETIG